MPKQEILDKYKGLSVRLVNSEGKHFIVTKPLSLRAINEELRKNRNEFGSYVTDYIRGREVSYEQYDGYVSMTIRVWKPGGDFSTDPNAYTKTTKVKNISSARRMAREFILD